MKYLGIIFPSIIVILIPFIFKYYHANKKNNQISSNVIRQPKICFFTGIIGIIIMNIAIPLMCLLELDPSMNWYQSLAFMSIIIVPADVLYIYLLMLAINWKILVFDDYVEYYNIFKKKRIFNFCEYKVKKYKASLRIVKQKKEINKKKYYLNVSSYCNNYEILLKKFNNYKNKLKTNLQ